MQLLMKTNYIFTTKNTFFMYIFDGVLLFRKETNKPVLKSNSSYLIFNSNPTHI